MATADEYHRAAQAVQRGNPTKYERELNDRAASGARWGNKIAQDAQDAQQGKLKH